MLWRATEVEGGTCRGISGWERSVAGVCSPASSKLAGCCVPVEKECVVRDTEGEERAAARALISVVGVEALLE